MYPNTLVLDRRLIPHHQLNATQVADTASHAWCYSSSHQASASARSNVLHANQRVNTVLKPTLCHDRRYSELAL